MAKWSSIRNGLKLRSFGVPTLLRTRAPAPSDCSTARNDLAILRGASVVSGSLGGITGSPRNVVAVVVMFLGVVKKVLAAGVMCLARLATLESMYSLW